MSSGIINTKLATAASELKYIAATEKYLSEIDKKANKLRDKILNSKTSITVTGTTYYVSNKGNDLNDGKSANKAWATLEKISSADLKSGDAVLFERSGTFRGSLAAKAGVTYSAYGNGDKPELLGSMQNYSIREKWKETGIPNVYVYDEELADDAGLIVFNNGEAYTYKKVVGIDDFTGKISELKNDLEMYHSIDDKKIYLYSDRGNPAKRFSSIEFCLNVYIVSLGLHNNSNITIDNLCLKYSGALAIGAGTNNRSGTSGGTAGTCSGLTVTNCVIGWIGGSLLSSVPGKTTVRYGNAVEIFGNSSDYTIDSCYVYQIYDAGLTHHYTSGSSKSVTIRNVKYTNNLIEYCTYSLECSLSTPKDGTTPERMMSDIVIKDNICRYAGYGWGDQRPNKKEAAHIKTWDTLNPAENYVIENNIFDRSKYMLIHIGASDARSLPVMKNNTYIQTAGSEFGRFGVNPTRMVTFDKDIVKYIMDDLKEQEAGIAYVIPEKQQYQR